MNNFLPSINDYWGIFYFIIIIIIPSFLGIIWYFRKEIRELLSDISRSKKLQKENIDEILSVVNQINNKSDIKSELSDLINKFIILNDEAAKILTNYNNIINEIHIFKGSYDNNHNNLTINLRDLIENLREFRKSLDNKAESVNREHRELNDLTKSLKSTLDNLDKVIVHIDNNIGEIKESEVSTKINVDRIAKQLDKLNDSIIKTHSSLDNVLFKRGVDI